MKKVFPEQIIHETEGLNSKSNARDLICLHVPASIDL